jgi:DNA polymerase III alpha subunit (gram-positive type)
MVTILMISLLSIIVIGVTIYAIRMKNKAELAENAFKGLLQNYQASREEVKKLTLEKADRILEGFKNNNPFEAISNAVQTASLMIQSVKYIQDFVQKCKEKEEKSQTTIKELQEQLSLWKNRARVSQSEFEKLCKEKYECIEKERPEPGTLVRQSLEGENIKEWALDPGITSIVTLNGSFSDREKEIFGKQAYKCIKEGLPLIFFREDGQEVPYTIDKGPFYHINPNEKEKAA